MPQRIRGQETFFLLTIDGNLVDRIDSITEFEYTSEFDTQEDNFLGETQPRFDSIGKGISFRFSGQIANDSIWDLQQAITDKAERRAGGASQIDIGTTYVSPNGDIVNIALRDVSFGSMPITTGAREEFVTWTGEGKASRSERI